MDRPVLHNAINFIAESSFALSRVGLPGFAPFKCDKTIQREYISGTYLSFFIKL